MGLLVKGQWQDQWYDTDSHGGEFIRTDAQFRHHVTADGSSGYQAEAGRYHLFVSLACPWAHRTLIFRKLKKLESIIGVTVVKPEMLDQGWELLPLDDAAAIDPSPIPDIRYLYEVYTTTQQDYSGRVTVPVLWDKHTQTIVNNESAEIIRMFNREFDAFTDVSTDFYPKRLRQGIDDINATVYDNVNNGVYKAGFATSQTAYEKAFNALFSTLKDIEQRLERQRFLVDDQITEADWRLFTTLIRFDSVYYGHFKTNLKRIEDYPNLSNYLRELYQVEGVAETVNFKHIKTHYYYSHDTINPTRIVPLGPEVDYSRPHNRPELFLLA
ncbi:glutathione S-transferase family protein [Aestuariicella hydrocarbonica]|uniref:Glutathione S-transferase family protein n=1 Tax=Pseudomaricurvus hydrocarbonicus TaxID=1470433 RepID=A0A9E5T352_9GAMM|nr:glutathione S-transferase family protein [Aestuariicella hydrocarbonica]NHO68461.1 glutathione S-transferase family protein [Aestuariicella hydrocarbonica]